LRASTSDKHVYALLVSIVDALFTAEPWKMSLLHFLFYLKSNSGLENMVSFSGGNQAERITGGSHLISERIATALGDDVVRLNTPVRAITQHGDGVTVAHEGGEYTAERVIVAIPPTLAGRIDYRPSLPAIRDKLTQQYPMGSVVKAQVAYAEPFWRSDGLSGFADSLDEPPFFTIDSSPADGSCGVLAGLFVARGARRLEAMSPEDRRQLVLECLARTHGPRAAEPLDYAEKVWSAEEYTRGCYGGHLAPGAWTQYGPALAEPVGLIHWAGTETSDISNGYMDGAVRSGKRAASEVIAALSPPAVAR
jgi:monoamine oxidase